MPSSKVSVIIPCYNHGAFVGEAVDSVLAQTFQDFEIVIVDDGSTDKDTLDILKGFDKPKTQVVHAEHQGLAEARNVGIRNSSGTYILPLDADDKISPEYLAEAVRVLDGDDEVKIVYCNAERFGAQTGPWEHPCFSLQRILANNLIFCTAFFRRKDYDKTRGYDKDLRLLEDWDFWLSLLETGGTVHKLPGTHFFYRSRPDSMLQTLTTKSIEQTRKKIFRNHAALYSRDFQDPINLYWEKTLLQGSYEYRLGRFLLRPVRFMRRAARFLARHCKRIMHPPKPEALINASAPPKAFHFLMTNYCNARCIFCNQRFGENANNEITLEKFKVMASHIAAPSVEEFHFSGGGEPLLCRDLPAIIRYVNETFPWIDVVLRTNGLLVGRYAQELARLNIARLEVSIHGLAQTNDAILQRQSSQDIFTGIEAFQNALKRLEKSVYIQFEPSISRMNIQEVPALIEKAHALKVDSVRVYFCRFFPHRLKDPSHKLKEEDSMYFHKALYNRMMRRCKRLAEKLEVEFYHEPLFSWSLFGAGAYPCCQPWSLMLVDWDGDVYPCTGGEEWFKAQVKSGKYYFGNLLKEDVQQCWNNPDYLRIRRTCTPSCRELSVPECSACHSTICFLGPDVRHAHFIRPN
ncbi:MAG: glycosyltransferase [Elusimicrobiota bacterium]|jgi:glycosyltransferase involved in cell wall biosynthesis/MoaA/NifB/PqqE/SkfB family radical SAM enzyme